MITKTIEISDIEEIVLTNNGMVVGFIRVEHGSNLVQFRGSAVNLKNFDNYQFTHNGFWASSEITTDKLDELSSSENFINALKVAN